MSKRFLSHSHVFTGAPEEYEFDFMPSTPQMLTLTSGQTSGVDSVTWELRTRTKNGQRWVMHPDFPRTGEYQARIDMAVQLKVKVTARSAPDDGLLTQATLEDQSIYQRLTEVYP